MFKQFLAVSYLLAIDAGGPVGGSQPSDDEATAKGAPSGANLSAADAAKQEREAGERLARAGKPLPDGASASAREGYDSVEKPSPSQATSSTDAFPGVGLAQKPKDEPFPEDAIIRRKPAVSESVITETAEVRGNRALMVIDIINARPINNIIILEGHSLDPAKSGVLVVVEGGVTVDVLPEEKARGKFALDPEGTVLFNSRGFDEVGGQAQYDYVDIVRLVKATNGGPDSQLPKGGDTIEPEKV